ncbi:thionin-like protein 2 [Cynara cardunculus var. scolymus]|uniref:thionin-like protein 2 n=1 Tax=Cynara cardunculus var. scolymus TaxID=59895 RepID=UPI000D62A2B0|nr:thionin-like protein 2 [Cynara cardunculus var. scolymus]
MEMKGLLKIMVVVVMVMGGCRGDVNSFRDCYAKCFIFCMIEPNKSLCTCTTQCLKECIFPSLPSAIDQHSQNLAYCKLGCATSMCSNISKTHNPDGKNMESCVGSCSNKCTMSYSSSSP